MPHRLLSRCSFEEKDGRVKKNSREKEEIFREMEEKRNFRILERMDACRESGPKIEKMNLYITTETS